MSGIQMVQCQIYQKKCLVLGSWLEYQTFNNGTGFIHLNTGLARFLDFHWSNYLIVNCNYSWDLKTGHVQILNSRLWFFQTFVWFSGAPWSGGLIRHV